MLKPFALALSLVVMSATVVYAEPGPGPGPGQSSNGQAPGGQGQHGQRDQGGKRWSSHEREQIRDYYRGNPRQDAQIPPANSRKKMVRGKPIPPELQWHVDDDLMRRMPPRAGYEYRVVGTDVLLVEIATGLIADLLRSGARPR